MIQIENRAEESDDGEDDDHAAYYLIDNDDAVGIKLVPNLVDEPGESEPPQQGSEDDKSDFLFVILICRNVHLVVPFNNNVSTSASYYEICRITQGYLCVISYSQRLILILIFFIAITCKEA